MAAMALAGAAGAAPVAAAQPQKALIVAPLKSDIGEGDVVGVIKAGLICLPASRVQAREFIPELEAGLRKHLDNRVDPLPATRLEPQLIDAKFSLCAPGWGLGDRTTFKGDAAITLRWSFMGVGAPHSRVLVTKVRFKSAGGKRYSLASFADEVGRLAVEDLDRLLSISVPVAAGDDDARDDVPVMTR